MKLVIEARDMAIEQIRKAFPDNRFNITAHPGRFSESDIRQAAQKTPAIITSVLRINESNDTIHFSSFILYRATSADRLYDGALEIASKLICVLKNIENESALDVPGEISAECLFSVSLDSMNITLWAVSWSWEFPPHSLSGGMDNLSDLDFFNGADGAIDFGNSAVKYSVDIGN